MNNTQNYTSSLSERYPSKEMKYLFSPEMKFRTWRKLWIALAESEKELGLPITDEQIAELKAAADDINYEAAKEREKIVRHDVMSHVYAYGLQCPNAKGIIHLGATSCYVGDNTDLIIMTEALRLVRKKLINVIANLADFAEKYKTMPALGFTHFQPAQPTTVGKRATLWLHDLVLDLEDLDHVLDNMKLLGSKGTTGTQASFLELFDGDLEKVKKIDGLIAEKMGFDGCYPVSGQTYSRKIDSRVLNVLAGIAQSAHKFSNDIRLLQHLKEIEEPFEKNQIGSSAMAYKRNPMRSERIAALSNFVIAGALNPAITASTLWKRSGGTRRSCASTRRSRPRSSRWRNRRSSCGPGPTRAWTRPSAGPSPWRSASRRCAPSTAPPESGRWRCVSGSGSSGATRC